MGKPDFSKSTHSKFAASFHFFSPNPIPIPRIPWFFKAKPADFFYLCALDD